MRIKTLIYGPNSDGPPSGGVRRSRSPFRSLPPSLPPSVSYVRTSGDVALEGEAVSLAKRPDAQLALDVTPSVVDYHRLLRRH